MDQPTITLIVAAALLVGVLLLSWIPNRKQEKRMQEMLGSVGPGDKIRTVGGLIGTIVEVYSVSDNEKHMVIETGTGDNKSTVVYDIRALDSIIEKFGTPEIDPELVEKTEEEKADKTEEK